MEIAGHEFFSPDGKVIWYDLQICACQAESQSAACIAGPPPVWMSLRWRSAPGPESRLVLPSSIQLENWS